MLHLFRWHSMSCPHYHKGRQYKKCLCPIWVDGYIEGKRINYSLKIRDWSLAQRRVRDIESDGISAKSGPVLVHKATEAFLNEMGTRELGKNTQRKFKHLLARLKDFSEKNGFLFLTQLSSEEVRTFRATWKLAPSTASKELERLKSFFKFCVDSGWLDRNPAQVLKPPKFERVQVVPFTEDQLNLIWKACEEPRLKILAQLLLATGLRIGDASVLTRDKIVKTDQGYEIRLRTTKTGTYVNCAIQDELAKDLIGLSGTHPFWTGESTVDANSGMWRKRFGRMFKKAKVAGHPHMFRHTFITRLLVAGVPVEDVAELAGNSPAIIRKHYSAWTKERQQRLGDAVRKTWA